MGLQIVVEPLELFISSVFNAPVEGELYGISSHCLREKTRMTGHCTR